MVSMKAIPAGVLLLAAMNHQAESFSPASARARMNRNIPQPLNLNPIETVDNFAKLSKLRLHTFVDKCSMRTLSHSAEFIIESRYNYYPDQAKPFCIK
jgi:hypothetical protein